MVGLVIVSHSRKIAKGVEELTSELVVREVPLVSVGGREGRLGTDIAQIIDAVKNVYSEEGVIIIGDVGSSLMNSTKALKLLELEGYNNVLISNAPLIEGAMVAVVESSLGKDLMVIKDKIESERLIELV